MTDSNGSKQVVAKVEVFAGARKGLVKEYTSLSRARRFADKLDLEYGSICCAVRYV